MIRQLAQAVLAVIAAVVVTGLAATDPRPVNAGASRLMKIQLLAINDLHGNLEPPQGADGMVLGHGRNGRPVWVPAGGLGYLATHLERARRGEPNSLTIGAGDLIGASPLLSSAFHDEPTILGLARLNLAVSSVGNHEFDEGLAELLRIAGGGCRSDDGCYDPGRPYAGTSFHYLAANVLYRNTREPILPPVWVADINGARIGFIGLVLRGTTTIVSAEALAGLDFVDEVSTANWYARQLSDSGVDAIVVLVHQGGWPRVRTFDNDCRSQGRTPGITGPIVDIARRLDPRIDLVVSGHTHESYVCEIRDPSGRPRLVTSASSFGRVFTEIEGGYDPRSGDFVRDTMTAHNVLVSRDVPVDPVIGGLVRSYERRVGPIANRPVGYIQRPILGPGADTAEQPLGDVIADAQLEATSSVATGGSELALVNPSTIRADLRHTRVDGQPSGLVTYADAFAAQPFNNKLITMDLTGAQLIRVLRQQFTGENARRPRYLQVSSGLRYRIDRQRWGGEKLIASSIQLNGRPLEPWRTYRVTVNNFLGSGREGFTELSRGTRRLVGPMDIDAFVSYLTARSAHDRPFAPPPLDRIVAGWG
jgi:5'-nucleotidase